MKKSISIVTALIFLLFLSCQSTNDNLLVDGHLLDHTVYLNYVQQFNTQDAQAVVNYIPNDKVFDWLNQNIPLFECPDTTLEKVYYYRWWTFRKHIKLTTDGFVLTEFITPVKHAGKYNTVSCALGHHLSEGRWLHDNQYLDQYILFWLKKNNGKPQPHFHQFSSWAIDAIYERYLVNQDTSFILDLFDDFVADFKQWESEKQLDSGLFWQFDVRDGMEESISGSRKHHNARPTINSYMYANALAISRLAQMKNQPDLQKEYSVKASKLQMLIHQYLWDQDSQFFKVRFTDNTLSDAREAIGYIPWMFGLVKDSASYNDAWHQIKDEKGFSAPWGLTTAERRHPGFRTHGTGSCEWDGAVWPFASTQTIKGLARLLHEYQNHSMTRSDYFNTLLTYARSHQKNGKIYIGEYQDEVTGEWLKGENPRSIYYNHSTFCDLVISGLIGLQPRADNILVIDPLVPEDEWEWFCLDNILYHNHLLTILWDKTGKKYGKDSGFQIFVDKKLIFKSNTLTRVETEF